MISLTVNGRTRELDVPDDKPLLWVLREDLKLFGTKFGCGVARCGACTVLREERDATGKTRRTATRSCVLPVDDAKSTPIVTIEGLSPDRLHPVQEAWVAEQVPQCGYCQSGQVLAAVALLEETPQPKDEDIDLAMAGNLCRCGTYPRIRKAVKRAAAGR